MKRLMVIVVALSFSAQAHGQSDPSSGTVFYPSCLAAADIVQGRRPVADSEDAAKQLRQAAICFGAVTAILNLQPRFKPEFAICPPAAGRSAVDQAIPLITAYFRNHPEALRANFHQTAAAALATAWPCPK